MDRPRQAGIALYAIATSVFSLTAATARPLDKETLEEGQQTVVNPGSRGDSVNLFGPGQNAVTLYGPWRFHIDDSPVDPVTRAPLWAQTNFDDSGWEIVSLAPVSGSRIAGPGEPEIVPGWTAKHKGYWGFAWYRIHLNLETHPWKGLALAVPNQVNDAYQVFLDGQVLGSFGDLTPSRPVTYYPQPMLFPFTASGNSPAQHVIAFRVWMEPNTLKTIDESGGLRSAPLIGEENAIAVVHQVRWLELIRSYSPFVIDAFSFALLAMMTFSFILFDRSDHVYPWMGGALTLMAAYSALGAMDLWTQHLSILQDQLIVRCTIGPLAYAGWFMVWWEWFHRKRPAWMPMAATGLAIAYMVLKAVALSLSLKYRPVAKVFDDLSLIPILIFFTLLSSLVVQGIRRRGLEGWLVLPAVILLAIPAIQDQPLFLRLAPTWLVFGTQITVWEVANLVLALVVALLLLRRLLLSVRRQRLIELDAKRVQLQSEFVAAVSHEFRTPLTPLRSITELLLQGRITDEARRREGYAFLNSETARLQRFVEDLLDLSRWESNQYRLETCDAFQLVRAAVTDLHEEAEAKGFQIQTSLVTVPASIRADDEALRRTVRNLLENAMKYSPQCRTVWVDGKIDHHRVSISVRDHGMGIAASEQRLIFERFRRSEAAKKAGIKGTGLGLAMVKQITEAMGGEIQLQSEVGVGSTFTILLPLAKE